MEEETSDASLNLEKKSCSNNETFNKLKDLQILLRKESALKELCN